MTLNRTASLVIRAVIALSLLLALVLGSISAIAGSTPTPEPTKTSTLYGIPCVPDVPIPGCP